MTDEPSVALTAEFNMALGWFHTAWAATEVLIDFAIGAFLRLEHEETHLLTAGIEYGRKTTLLRNLLKRSSHPQKAKLIRSLNTIQNESKRNVFAHSYIITGENKVTFIERSRGGAFSERRHKFSLDEFRNHVEKFLKATEEFERTLSVESEELEKFIRASSNLASKS